MKIRISYITDKGEEFGLEESIPNISEIDSVIDSIISVLKKDYNARCKGKNARWA